MPDSIFEARCSYCGAVYRLFTISNRSLKGLCKGWKKRHEKACGRRTPAQRREWAKKYAGKDRYDAAVVVDLSLPAFKMEGDCGAGNETG